MPGTGDITANETEMVPAFTGFSLFWGQKTINNTRNKQENAIINAMKDINQSDGVKRCWVGATLRKVVCRGLLGLTSELSPEEQEGASGAKCLHRAFLAGLTFSKEELIL